MTVLESAAALAFFRNSGTAILIPAFAALLIFSLWGEAESRRRSGNSIRFAFLDFSRAKLKKQVTGLVLCGIILFIPQWSSGRALFTEEQFRPVYGNAVSLAAKLYPDLDLSGSVRDFAYGFAAISLARNKDFKMLPPDQQKAAVTKAGELMIQDARANLGFPISPDTSMSHVFYEYANGFIGNARAQSGSMFIVVAAVVLFMIARSLAAFFTLAAFILAWLLYQVLGALGVVQVIGETATRERLAVN